VAVTNEVGMSVVPERRSGRVFRDLLGTVNQRVAEECEDVMLVVAGRVLRL
jgi:adenosylcobinamide kinase/adenosylcobinamide-phosphate guanylyltransferase